MESYCLCHISNFRNSPILLISLTRKFIKMADRIDTTSARDKEKKRSLGVLVNARSACRLVEPGQRRSGEVTSVAFMQKTTCWFAFFPYNGVCSLQILLHIVEILGWSVSIDSTLWNF